MNDWRKTLFVGWDAMDGVTHYRTLLPAKALGAEYVVFDGQGGGVARSGTNKKHDNIVIQHTWIPWQVRIVRNMQKMGSKVFVNVDDWIPTIARMGEKHFMSGMFKDPEVLKHYYSLLREADGLIAATPWLVEKLSGYNKNVQLARNGLDLRRYEQWARDEPNDNFVIGWAGGTGHRGALLRIVPELCKVLRIHRNVEIHLVGDDHTMLFPGEYRPRVKHVEWSDMHMYPKNLARFDINLAPAEDHDFYKAKSQLRFYEACAMGTPTVGHKMYSEIQDSGGGLIVVDEVLDDWSLCINSLIEDPRWLQLMSDRCRSYTQVIDIGYRVQEWQSAIQKLARS